MSPEEENLRAQTSKLRAETAKVEAETKFYPVVIVTALYASIAALSKLLGQANV